MANKLFLVSATLAFFFLLANASIYRTVVEFDDEATNPWPIHKPDLKKECQKEFRQEEHLQACQQWIHQQAKQSGAGSIWSQGPQQRPELLEQCCEELRDEKEVCVCPTLEGASKAVRSRMQQQPGQEEEFSEVRRRIFQTATRLPKKCNIQGISVCPFEDSPSHHLYY